MSSLAKLPDLLGIVPMIASPSPGLFWWAGSTAHRFWIAALLAMAVPSTAARGQTAGAIKVHLEEMASWLSPQDVHLPSELTPVDMIQLPDGTDRFLVATLGGQIRVMTGAGSLLPTPFMTPAQTNNYVPIESGLTSIAVHPNFGVADTFGFGKFYTITAERPGSRPADFSHSGTGTDHQKVVREWDLSSFVGHANANVYSGAYTDSREILRIDEPGPFHGLYDMAFDSWGNLLLSQGDGGTVAGYDRFAAAQDLSNVYGSLLRIDPNPSSGHGMPSTNGQYVIPADNPFVGQAGALGEIWAYGFRSPWRLSWDFQEQVAWVGDVGEATREEFSRVVAGGNYGWPHREGSVVQSSPTATDLIGPIFEYGRDVGRNGIGGFIYRGTAIPELVGKYVFADTGQSRSSATLFYGDPTTRQFAALQIDATSLTFPNQDGTPIPLPDRVLSFAEDLTGELYLIAGQDPRLVAPSAPGAFVVRILPSPWRADFNSDLSVDAFDADILFGNWGQPGLGDFNQDQIVDAADASLLFETWTGDSYSALAVPEPVSVGMFAIFLALVAGRR